MNRSPRHLTFSLLAVGSLALAACGGSDGADDAGLIDDAAPAVTAASDDAATSGLAPDEPTDPDDPAVSGEAPDSESSGGAYSGGVVATSFDGVCDILDAARVAELFSIEPTSIVSSANTSTGICEFGDGATVRLDVTRPDLASNSDAPDFYRETMDFIIADGIEVTEADVDGVLRAAFIERGDAVVAFALDPYYVEIRNTTGQDIALTALIADVEAALR